MKPAGYDSQITRWAQLSTDQLVNLHKGIHDRAVKDTINRILGIIDLRISDNKMFKNDVAVKELKILRETIMYLKGGAE